MGDRRVAGVWGDFSSVTGAGRELADIVRHLDDWGVENVVFLTGDVHFPANVRYELDANEDGDTVLFHELVRGPLNASLGRGYPLNSALSPEVLYAEDGFFNFGYVLIEEQADGLMHLYADVRGEDGQPRPGSELDLAPR